jgi:hypothetical protein
MQAGHLTFALLLLASIAARAETLVGTVVGVADGDIPSPFSTLTISNTRSGSGG